MFILGERLRLGKCKLIDHVVSPELLSCYRPLGMANTVPCCVYVGSYPWPIVEGAVLTS